MGKHEENFKDNSAWDTAPFSKGMNSKGEEVSFEQLLGQAEIQGASSAAAGSVTQLFSRVGGSAEQKSIAPAAPSAPHADPQHSSAPVARNINEASAAPPPDALKQQEVRSEAPGDFTRIFTRPPAPSPAVHEETPDLHAAPKGGDFTNFFRMHEQAKTATEDQVRSSEQSTSHAGKESVAEVPNAPAEAGNSIPSSPFTSAGSAPVRSFAPAKSQPASGGFTELLNLLGSERAAGDDNANASGETQFSPVKPPAVVPARRADEANGFTNFFSAQSPDARKPSSSPDAVSRPGEFTQLLQSLQRPSESRSEGSAAAMTPPAQPMHEAASSSPSSAGSSDFTRVMKSSAARANSASVPSSVSPPQQSGGGIELPSGAPASLPPLPPATLPAVPARTLLEKLAPWLLVMNGVLLVLLVVLVFLFLLRQHH